MMRSRWRAYTHPKKNPSRDYLPVTQVALPRCIVGRTVSEKMKKGQIISSEPQITTGNLKVKTPLAPFHVVCVSSAKRWC